MNQIPGDRFNAVPQEIVLALESLGYYYVGCTPIAQEVGEFCEIEAYLDWEIQTEPIFAVAHKPTGHYWMPWGEAPEDAATIKRVIRAGTEMQLTKAIKE